MRFSLLLFASLLFPVSAHAKSNSWWDCFFRQFELCSGKVSDPDAPEKGNKGYCDGQARATCEEEEAKKVLKPGDGAQSSNNAKGKLGTSGSGASVNSTISTKADEILSPPSSPQMIVEGNSPSGDKTVLGVDVSLSIAEMAQAYKGRNIHGCRPIDDAFTRVLCLDSPSGKGSMPIELEFYRGRLVSLNYEAAKETAVPFTSAIAVAEEKTGARAAISSLMGSVPGHSKYCMARFPLGGGAMTLHGLPESDKGDSCDPVNMESASMMRVEWAPSSFTLREIAHQRKADQKPTLQELKKIEIEKTKAKLPL